MKKYLLYIVISLLFAGCSTDDVSINEDKGTPVTISSSIVPFEGESSTRANLDGNAFKQGDMIRIKVICPFVSGTMRGESSDSGSPDGLFFYKWNGSGWTLVTSSDGFDFNGDYVASGSPNLSSWQEAQQTPYVFTADTWSEERSFIIDGKLRLQQTNVFHHDQRKEKNHLASDVLWAQTIMQTGGTNVLFSFQHKMACLDITVDETGITPALTNEAVLTLEKMPNIDQCEILVGNYYADADKYNTAYGYRYKYSSAYEWNGHVLGVAQIDENDKNAKVRLLPGANQHGGQNTTYGPAVVADGTYTAYKISNTHFRLMVPPCTLTENAVFWLRDGERRYNVALTQKTFEEGKMYKIQLKFDAPNE